MIPKPIRTSADYKASLARAEALMDAKPGSREADELDVLTTLIDRYEEETFAIEAPTPIDAIRFRMEQQGLSARDLEPFIGSRARVSEVLSGARSLSIDMIRALNLHLGIPAESLLGSAKPNQRATPSPLSTSATKLLVAGKYLRPGEAIEAMFSRVFGREPAAALLRKTRTARTNAKTDQVALHAWCAAVMQEAAKVKVTASFDPKLLGSEIRSIAKLSVYADGPKRVRKALSDLGIIFIALPHLPGTHLDGAAMRRVNDGAPIVALTLRRDRIDNFWFTLLHELAHVRFHLTNGISAIFDDLEVSSSDAREQEADRKAQIALIPNAIWASFNAGTYASLNDVLETARRAEVNPAIVAGRWQMQNRDFRKFSKLLGHNEVRRCFPEVSWAYQSIE